MKNLIMVVLILIIIVQGILLVQFKRQIADICRQLAFLLKNDSNMMVTSEIKACGIRGLVTRINELLALRHQEKEAYLAKEKIIADTYTNLSHDIRTPLTSLDGYFQLLEESEDKAEQSRYIQIIQNRIHSLKDMLEELFTYTKLKNESYELELHHFCVNRLLKETIFSYYDEWKKQEIDPEIHITEKELTINGNVQGLTRTIQNIIKNALDHGVKSLRLTLDHEEEWAVLRIYNEVDDPKSIDVTQVFERFYKQDAARSQNSTGLGLSIAKEFVERMDGQITAQVTEKEFGIEIRLPVCRK